MADKAIKGTVSLKFAKNRKTLVLALSNISKN